ncbi:MAG: hypothetical protein DRJ10_16150, partial [Bacteroidetes bacterium]
MQRKILITSLSILFCITNISAQISHGGQPLSFEHSGLKSISVFNTPLYDYQQMIKEDEETSGKVKPFRFGKTHNVSLSPENSGVWQNLANGEKVWRLKIRSKNAFSIGLLFKDFYLNEGVRFFMYSADKSIVNGAFTSLNNKVSRVFSTLPLAGDELALELNIPKGMDYGKFEISGIVHDFKNVFGLKTGYGSSGSCNVNINCPDGDDWQKEKRSIVLCVFSGSLCTGVLINNTKNDATPYLLTAEHCVSSISGANNAVFRFNYESENCIATSNPSYQSISSADLVATGGNLDFSLLELSIDPPIDYNVYYAGWNRSTSPATNTVCIHHPQGDIKKITLDYDPPTTGSYTGYVNNSHWWIHEWDVGTTEGGSSGSPIFDENHHIVGDLTGGDASCSYNFNDYYAKFDMSWDYYSEPSQQLKTWLDPDNTGVMTLDGYEKDVPVLDLDVKIKNIFDPNGSYCMNNQVVPGIEINNNSINELTSVQINYQINGGVVVSENWTGNLASGQSDTVLLNSIYLPVGIGKFKAFTSLPNGGDDQDKTNDTLVSDFFAQEIVDIKLVDIIDPNGSYCNISPISPKIVIQNIGLTELTYVTIKSQINEQTILSEDWIGLLKTNEVDTFLLQSINLPQGNGSYKVFISLPDGCGGNDLSDDTLVSVFEGQVVIENLLIEGDETICLNSYSGSYYTNESGEYSWTINDGELISGDETDSVRVDWNDWGYREVNLTVTNLCGEYSAETFLIEPLEQSAQLEISAGQNTVFWDLKDSEGNTVHDGIVLPNSGNYSIPLCLMSECYSLFINSELSCTDCTFRLTNNYNNIEIIDGSFSNVQKEFLFCMHSTSGYAFFNLYPNPSSAIINIEANFIEAYENAVYSIYSLSGALVTPENPLNGRTTINISELRKGYYILRIKSDYG